MMPRKDFCSRWLGTLGVVALALGAASARAVDTSPLPDVVTGTDMRQSLSPHRGPDLGIPESARVRADLTKKSELLDTVAASFRSDHCAQDPLPPLNELLAAYTKVDDARANYVLSEQFYFDYYRIAGTDPVRFQIWLLYDVMDAAGSYALKSLPADKQAAATKTWLEGVCEGLRSYEARRLTSKTLKIDSRSCPLVDCPPEVTGPTRD